MDTRVVKCSLKAFCKDEELRTKISQKALQMHRVAVETMHLMGLDLRSRYEDAVSQRKVPEEAPWTMMRVRAYFMCVTTTTTDADKPIKSVPPSLYTLRNTSYSPLRKTAGLLTLLEERCGLPGNSVQETCKNIAASVVTNIKEHFFSRQLRYIRLRDGLDKKSARSKQQKINEQTGNTTDDSLPAKIEKSVAYDLQVHPELFLYPMWKMNQFFAKKGQRTFAILPLSTGFIPSSVLHIDTDALKAMAGKNEKSKVYKQTVNNKRKVKNEKEVSNVGHPTEDQICKMSILRLRAMLKDRGVHGYTKMNKQELQHKLTALVQSEVQQMKTAEKKGKEEESDHEATTDDNNINNNNKDEAKEHKKRKAPGRNSDAEALDEKDVLWKAYFRIKHVVREAQSQRGIRFGHHITTDGVSVSVAVLHPAAAKQATETHKTKRKKSQKQEVAPHQLDDEDFLNDLRAKTIVGVDPGKHEIVHMTTDASPRDPTVPGNTLRYTSAQRRHESGATRRDAKIQRRKEKRTGIKDLEASLSKENSCSPTLEGFQSYLAARFKVQEKLYKFYGNPTFRLYRWWTWRDRRKSEDRLIQRAINLFGQSAVLAYGTWSSWQGMKGLASSPLASFRRRLGRKFQIVDVPEYNTSKTCSRCLGEAKPDPTRARIVEYHKEVDGKKELHQKSVPVRGLRRCNSVQCGGFLRWNRDHNAAINIRANLVHYILNRCWHPSFVPTSKGDAPVQTKICPTANPPSVSDPLIGLESRLTD